MHLNTPKQYNLIVYVYIHPNTPKYLKHVILHTACVPSCNETTFTAASGKTLETTDFERVLRVRKGTSAEL